CRAIIASSASTKRAGWKVPATAEPAALPTSTGAALATRNFGRVASKRITNLEHPEPVVIS
ncbi:MAG: hypothetical protein MUO33_05655, partial [Sedimentisphaerales bacterium]|nr:hypothetical protein [Sedimentisphaerales bacterium]